ncbi:MAG TPA: Mur ligase family protein [Candidatus Goldiibacteriota bacterium]|nr:Mur ligase family protein [Candidatus Goldiibacteriota bacterium]
MIKNQNDDIRDYLQGLNEFKFDFSLDRVKNVLNYFHNPQNDFKVIHVTGSNGKGSVAHFLSSTLKEAGYKTGLYTSPHLLDVRERIVIDGRMIDKKKFSNVVLQLKNLIESKKIKLTYFEFLTVVAFIVFKKSGVSVAIVEAGLGGRFDATNVKYERKMLSIITSIDLEHTNYLGRTKKSILLEKEKIIGSGIAVCNVKGKKLRETLLQLHKGKIFFPEDFFRIMEINQNKKFLELLVKSKTNVAFKIRTYMTEPVQAENVLTVLASLYVLKKRKLINVSRENVIKGIRKTIIPGRFTRHKKGYYLSVSHNPAAIKEMLKAAETAADNKRIVYIYSSLKDKNVCKIFDILSGKKNIYVILTTIDNERAISIEKLRKTIVKYDIKYKIEPDNLKALELAYKLKKDGIIIIGGSFYLVNRFL